MSGGTVHCGLRRGGVTCLRCLGRCPTADGIKGSRVTRSSDACNIHSIPSKLPAPSGQRQRCWREPPPGVRGVSRSVPPSDQEPG